MRTQPLTFAQVKIALIGYGKMGIEIEKIAIERNHEVIERFNSTNPANLDLLKKADVAIEFTNPNSAVEHIKLCFDASCPVVVGTTGWYQHFPEIELYCQSTNGSMLHATNFSLGVNIAFYMNELLAKVMSNHPQYKASITEIHHTKKLDAPSGTAISLAEGLIKNHSFYTQWELDENNVSQNSIPIHAIREADVPGTHYVNYSSAVDTLEIKHEAHNRVGFALGSVLAAEWITNKKGIYSMRDMLNFDALKQ